MRYPVEHARSTLPASVWAGLESLAALPPSPPLVERRLQPLALNALIDQLGFGVLLVDERGQVKLVNRLALMAIEVAAHLQISGGMVHASDKAEAIQLRAALGGAARGRRAFVRLAAGRGRQPSVVAVVPCTDSPLCNALQPEGLAGPAAPPVALIALIFERPAEPAALTVTLFAQTYRLTPTEQRVLSGLCDGQAAGEIAARTGSAVATVRCHVRSLLEKTGCANLRALTCRVANLPPLLPMDFSGISGTRQVLHA